MNKKRLLPLLLTIAAVALVGLWIWSHGIDVNVAISTSQRQFKLGDEILLDVIMSGKSGFGGTYGGAWYERIPFIGHRFWREPPSYDLELTATRKSGRQCVDPRAYMPLDMVNTFEPNESGEATVALNTFAVISEPGTYEVVAAVRVIEWKGNSFTEKNCYSKPIDVVITPRTDQEASSCIEQLLLDFRAAKTNEAKARAINKLICTRDRRIMPALIEWAYLEETTGLANRGFNYVGLDSELEVNDLILAAARERGLVGNTLCALQRFGCPEATFKDLISISLESKNPQNVAVGAAAAAEYPHDSHMTKLIELAEGTTECTSFAAIRAIALNRTDEGVSALKRILASGNQRLQAYSAAIIQEAYQPFHWRGRSWDWDFETISDLPRLARDQNSSDRWRAIRFLVFLLNREELARVKSLIGENSNKVELAATSDGVIVIEELLDDPDIDVRDFVTTCIRLTRPGYPGHPLKPEDFPEIYEEYKKERESESHD